MQKRLFISKCYYKKLSMQIGYRRLPNNNAGQDCIHIKIQQLYFHVFYIKLIKLNDTVQKNLSIQVLHKASMCDSISFPPSKLPLLHFQIQSYCYKLKNATAASMLLS